MAEIENVIIVGSGPAGYTAALYTARANLHPLVIEGFLWGGLLQQTTDVENYPGFPDGIMGPELMQKMRDQAERFGTRFETDLATKIELAREPGGIHSVWVGDTEHRTLTVILAMGHVPQSEIINAQLQTDAEGYVKVEGRSTRTGVPGVFAAGDVVDHTYRQAVTAAGTGCQAALDAEWYLRDTPEVPTPAGMPEGDLAEAQWAPPSRASAPTSAS